MQRTDSPGWIVVPTKLDELIGKVHCTYSSLWLILHQNSLAFRHQAMGSLCLQPTCLAELFWPEAQVVMVQVVGIRAASSCFAKDCLRSHSTA